MPSTCRSVFGAKAEGRSKAVLMLILMTAALSGCAVGNVGTLAAHVQRQENVSLVSVYSIGLHVRTRADDAGANLGYSKRTYVFAADDKLVPGWYFLRVPTTAGSSISQDLMTLGVDLSITAPDAELSVGYNHTRVFARVPTDVCMLIEFSSDLQVKKLTTLPEDALCIAPLSSL